MPVSTTPMMTSSPARGCPPSWLQMPPPALRPRNVGVLSVAGWDRESRSTETTPGEACSRATCPLFSVAASAQMPRVPHDVGSRLVQLPAGRRLGSWKAGDAALIGGNRRFVEHDQIDVADTLTRACRVGVTLLAGTGRAGEDDGD